MKTLCILIATALLCGCAAPKINTPSGANEVTIRAPMSQVRQELSSAIVNRGYAITRADDLLIEGQRDAGTTAAVLFGTGSNPYAQIRVRANLIASGDSVRVIVRGWLVDGHHNESPLNPNAKTQAWIDQVKVKCEAR